MDNKFLLNPKFWTVSIGFLREDDLSCDPDYRGLWQVFVSNEKSCSDPDDICSFVSYGDSPSAAVVEAMKSLVLAGAVKNSDFLAWKKNLG